MRKLLLFAALAATAACGAQAQDSADGWEGIGTADCEWNAGHEQWPGYQDALVKGRPAFRRQVDGATEYLIADAWGREGYNLTLRVADDGLVGADVCQIGLATGYGPIMFADRYTRALYNMDHGNPLEFTQENVDYYQGISAFYEDEGRFVIDGIYFADYDAPSGAALGRYANGKEVITLRGEGYLNYRIDIDNAAWRTDASGNRWMDVELTKNDSPKVELLALEGSVQAGDLDIRQVTVDMEYGDIYQDRIVTARQDGVVSLPIDGINEGSTYTVFAIWYDKKGNQIDGGCVEFDCPGEVGIQGVATETAGEAAWYDLTGRRVSDPRNGVYVKVQNGQAVKVVK